MCDDAIIAFAKNLCLTCRCSTGVVQLIRNQQAVSSNLIIGSYNIRIIGAKRQLFYSWLNYEVLFSGSGLAGAESMGCFRLMERNGLATETDHNSHRGLFG